MDLPDLEELDLSDVGKSLQILAIVDGLESPKKYDLVRDWCDRCYHEPKEYSRQYLPRKGTETKKFYKLGRTWTTFPTIFTPQGDGNSCR